MDETTLALVGVGRSIKGAAGDRWSSKIKNIQLVVKKYVSVVEAICRAFCIYNELKYKSTKPYLVWIEFISNIVKLFQIIYTNK